MSDELEKLAPKVLRAQELINQEYTESAAKLGHAYYTQQTLYKQIESLKTQMERLSLESALPVDKLKSI